MNTERQRLTECTTAPAWKKWGPYLSNGSGARFANITARMAMPGTIFRTTTPVPRVSMGRRRHRGNSDHEQKLCLSLALWNERDPILKERLFGLTNGEGNHGEDVKELYYYLDATPTHS